MINLIVKLSFPYYDYTLFEHKKAVVMCVPAFHRDVIEFITIQNESTCGNRQVLVEGSPDQDVKILSKKAYSSGMENEINKNVLLEFLFLFRILWFVNR